VGDDLTSPFRNAADAARSLAGAGQQHQLATGHAAEQALHERRAEEAGAAGDGDALSVEATPDSAGGSIDEGVRSWSRLAAGGIRGGCLGDHLHLSTIW